MIWLGIDPGETGALGIITDEGTCNVFDFRDPHGLFRIRTWASRGVAMHVMLEKVHSMPKQGVRSTFNFGENFGIWKGRLEALRIPYDLVTPAKWMTAMFDGQRKLYKLVTAYANDPTGIPKGATGILSPNITGKSKWQFKKKVVDTKAMSLERARRLFPNLAPDLALKKHHGRADGLLLAEYGRRLTAGPAVELKPDPKEQIIDWDPLA